jgi:alanine dehydrogenase
MRIGIPREIKTLEGRVSLTPAACSQLIDAGHEVFIERSAGLQSGYDDSLYQAEGVTLCENAGALYAEAELIVKVKEPVAGDLTYLRREHILFSYLHLAPAPELTNRLLQIGLTAVAFETVQLDNGHLPLLEPMSIIAGRLSGQIGTHLLHAPMGGKGIMLGGLATAERGNVVVLGAGNAGAQAVDVVARMGANVTVFDLNVSKLGLMQKLYPNVTALVPTRSDLEKAVSEADLLIGAVLVAGKRAPTLVSEEMVKRMSAGSVIIDIAVDQGGCIETIQSTDYSAPTYVRHGVLHFGVANMPGAVPRTSSQALSACIMPYVLKIAEGQLHEDKSLQRGINIENGEIVHPALK